MEQFVIAAVNDVARCFVQFAGPVSGADQTIDNRQRIIGRQGIVFNQQDVELLLQVGDVIRTFQTVACGRLGRIASSSAKCFLEAVDVIELFLLVPVQRVLIRMHQIVCEYSAAF